MAFFEWLKIELQHLAWKKHELNTLREMIAKEASIVINMVVNIW